MKILIAHNAYQQRGGEDVVVDAEIQLLRGRGHQVDTYRRHNAELVDHPGAAASAIWSRRTASEMEQLCVRERPDVIHVHNTFPLISPSLYWIAARHKIAVVQTLHNFRMLCPQAMFLREGKVCEDCIGKIPWRAVTRKCYRSSTTQSALLSGMLIAHDTLGTFRDKVTRYIALNDFCRAKFIKGGLPADRMRVKPNFVVSPGKPQWQARHGGLYVGRLSPEKGIDVLIRAVARLPRSMRILVAGKGPLEDKVLEVFGDDYLGYRDMQEIAGLMSRSLYVVVPSTCYETFGMVAIEAFANGTPVIASRHGSLGELIRDGETGLLVDPGDPFALAERLRWAESHPAQMHRMGQAARAEYEHLYTPGQNYKIMMDIYQEAIEVALETRDAA
ncbi:glycosyltransferase family 4 protein [Lacisediminimonas profundi]|uniref:glycosyltransferase family 4 protein n=1 Tax=Lacisediminimonas profundi TaxID=2603856 RepID=UPI00124B68A4|nr:glycosyltransferase family 4 protein [Lacisediminimonas profundi]